MATKSFSAYSKPTREDFALDVQAKTGETQSFKFFGEIAGITLLDFASATDQENTAAMAGAVRQLFETTLLEEDRERFFAFIADPKNGIDIEMLGEMAGYLAEVYTGRPLS